MQEVAIFGAKVFLVVFGLGLLIVLVAIVSQKAKHKPELEIEPLHKKFKQLNHFLMAFTATKSDLKKLRKQAKEEAKAEAKKPADRRLYVIDFKGDRDADQVDNLREEITAVLQQATKQDEVLIRVESPGGTVHSYGLAASQLHRIREKGIPLVVAVDKVAASGGYLMACVANRILAAPFAIIGSIGVAAPVPNFHRLLKKHEVDYREYTAGEYKRTVSLLGEITPQGEEKFKEQLEDVHQQFKSFVSHFRPQLNIEKVATGEYWLGQRALELQLVDELLTSDEYLLRKYAEKLPIYSIKYQAKQKILDRLSHVISSSFKRAVLQILASLEQRLFL